VFHAIADQPLGQTVDVSQVAQILAIHSLCALDRARRTDHRGQRRLDRTAHVPPRWPTGWPAQQPDHRERDRGQEISERSESLQSYGRAQDSLSRVQELVGSQPETRVIAAVGAALSNARGAKKDFSVEGMVRTYGFGSVVELSYEQAIQRTRAALKEQGFAVLTEIDLTATVKAKLDADSGPMCGFESDRRAPR
jgi:hypothetical protein